MTTGIRKFLFSSSLIAVLLAGGILLAGWLRATRPPAPRSDESKPPLLVSVRRVANQDLRELFTGYGTARAEADAFLAAEVHGVVVKVAEGLNEGTHVEAGQLLVRIDDRQYRHQLARAEALAADAEARIDQLTVEEDNISRLADIAAQELEVNRNELERVAALYEKELAAKKEYDFARLAFQQSQRQLLAYRNQIDLMAPRRTALAASRSALMAGAELAKLDLERCRITAPFAGEVVSLSVDEGDHVMVGSRILRLISTRLIEIPIKLPASVRRHIFVGARCTLEADTMPGVRWQGSVVRVAPMADVQSRTFAAYVEVENEAQRMPLAPGHFLTAVVEGPLLRDVLAVPRGALLGDHVFVVNDSVAHARAVRVDRFVGEQALVSGELNPGDLVILTNLDVLRDGARVRTQLTAEGTKAGDREASVPLLRGVEPEDR